METVFQTVKQKYVLFEWLSSKKLELANK